jgi:hypothetical protein
MALRECSRCKAKGGGFASCDICKKNGCECCVKDGVCRKCMPKRDGSPGFLLNGVPFHIGQQAAGSAWGEGVVFSWVKRKSEPRPTPRETAPRPRVINFLDAFEKLGKK